MTQVHTGVSQVWVIYLTYIGGTSEVWLIFVTHLCRGDSEVWRSQTGASWEWSLKCDRFLCQGQWQFLGAWLVIRLGGVIIHSFLPGACSFVAATYGSSYLHNTMWPGLDHHRTSVTTPVLHVVHFSFCMIMCTMPQSSRSRRSRLQTCC